MATYIVRGPLRYRDHDVGEIFEAVLDPDAEQRALRLGTIEVIDPKRTELRPGSYRLPDGWLPEHTQHGAPQGALLIEGSTR